MTAISQETKIALLTKNVADLTAALAKTDERVGALQEERNHALKWGIATLGAAVIAMGVWIFNQVTGGHIK